MVKYVELYLYNSASSFEAYTNVGTLKNRLENAMIMLGLRPLRSEVLAADEKREMELTWIFSKVLLR